LVLDVEHTLRRMGKAFPDQHHKLSKREFQNPQTEIVEIAEILKLIDQEIFLGFIHNSY